MANQIVTQPNIRYSQNQPSNDFISFQTEKTDLIRGSFRDCFDAMIFNDDMPTISLRAKLLRKNGELFRIQEAYRSPLMIRLDNQLAKALQKVRFNGLAFDNVQEVFSMVDLKNLNEFFVLNTIIENSFIEIQFEMRQVIVYDFQHWQVQEIFLQILSLTSVPCRNIFEIFGLFKVSFVQKLRKIKLEKHAISEIKNILQKQKEFNDCGEKTDQNRAASKGVFSELTVIEELEEMENESPMKRGGYFNVEKKKFMVEVRQENEIIKTKPIYLAEKTLRSTKRLHTIFNYEGKLSKEIQLLQHLSILPEDELENFSQYYVLQKKIVKENDRSDSQEDFEADESDRIATTETRSNLPNCAQVMHMEYYEENLQEYIEKNGKLSIDQTLDFLKQIIHSIIELHKCGIIHRDLKPGNFMLDEQDGKLKTKMIDYGESTHQSHEFTTQSTLTLGFSIPYSPIQCASKCKEGFNKKQIDYWSIGVMIMEFVKGRIPITYSKCFKGDILKSWPTEFNFFTSQYANNRFSVIQNSLILIAKLFMRVEPQNRLSPGIGLQIIRFIEKLSEDLISQQ